MKDLIVLAGCGVRQKKVHWSWDICQVKMFRHTFVKSPTKTERSLFQGFVTKVQTFTRCLMAHQTQMLFFIFHDVQQQQRRFYSTAIQT